MTPIAVDHERFLGYDVAAIATEKAGIIKPGATVVLAAAGPRGGRSAAAPGRRGRRHRGPGGIEFGLLHRSVAVGGQMLAIQGLAGVYEEVFLPLHGAHQAHNAACALAAVEALLGR